MVDRFDVDLLKKIKDVQGETCISIYIPTHQEGFEVNENMDIITFKNEIQDIQIQLSEYEFDNGSIDRLLKPAWDLISNISFWKSQSNGLAVFIAQDYFQVLRLPVSFKGFSVISNRFIFSPLIQALEMNNQFFLLSLNQYEFKLFNCTGTSIEEVVIDDVVSAKVEEALAPFQYKNDLYESIDSKNDTANVNLKKQVLERVKSNGDVSLSDFFRLVNEIVVDHLKDQTGPLILAGLEEWQSLYKKVNKYKNLWEQGFMKNVQFIPARELHKMILPFINPYFEKRQENTLARYHALAGTGMTSYFLENILFDANAGRIDTLFIPKDQYEWGTYNYNGNVVNKQGIPAMNNYCLLNYAASITLSNSGNVFLLDPSLMPEGGNIAAIYRY